MVNEFLLRLCNTSKLGTIEVEGAVFFPKQSPEQERLRIVLGCTGDASMTPLLISSLVSGYSQLINLFGPIGVPAERHLYTMPTWYSPNGAVILPKDTEPVGLYRTASEWPVSDELLIDFSDPSEALISLTGTTLNDLISYTQDTDGVISADWPEWSGLVGDISLGEGEDLAVFVHRPASVDWSVPARKLRSESGVIRRLTNTPSLDHAFYTASTDELKVAVAATILAESNEDVS